ncbi:MAG: GNAT family N-acetyltransferase [Dehalococcoidia bacterium]|nr:GNAT family N-acetyltransferase [Dehalococcoidia bacterium]
MACEQVLEQWSRPAVLRALDCNTTRSYMAGGSCESLIVCREEVLPYVMTSFPFPQFNVFMKPRLVEDNAEAYVETSICLAMQNRVPITWWLGALPTPESLGRILTEHGFVSIASPWGMAAQLLSADLESTLKLKVVEVTHAGQLDEFSAVMCPAHAMSEGARVPWTEIFRAFGYGEGKAWRHFIGYLGEQAVATSSSFTGMGVVSATHVAVAPDYRGWGFGGEMVAWPMRLARDLGYRIGVLWAMDVGRPACEKIGFTSLCRGQVYAWTPG